MPPRLTSKLVSLIHYHLCNFLEPFRIGFLKLHQLLVFDRPIRSAEELFHRLNPRFRLIHYALTSFVLLWGYTAHRATGLPYLRGFHTSTRRPVR